MQAVQAVAFAHTMECAFITHTTGQTFNEMGIGALAVEGAFAYERLVVEGKQGTNDPQLFRDIFRSVVPRVYPAALAMFQSIPDALPTLETCDEIERRQLLLHYASQRIDLLNASGNDPLVLD